MPASAQLEFEAGAIMTKPSPETHLLRELHALATPIVFLVALGIVRFWNPVVGPELLIGSYTSLFLAATTAFGLLALIRGRRFKVRVSLWSALVSGLINGVVISSLALAFRIWIFQWPFNQEPSQPSDYINDGGASWLISAGLVALSALIWVLGIIAVGSTASSLKSTRNVVRSD